MLLIYVYYAVVPEHIENKQRDAIFNFLKDKYPNDVLDDDNLEQVLVDIFEHEYLDDYDNLRRELQDYRGDIQL